MGQRTVAVQARITGFYCKEEDRMKGLPQLKIYLKCPSCPAASMPHAIPDCF